MKVFWEVDMQRDFVYPDGKLAIPCAMKIVPNAKRLLKYALKNEIPILGSVDKHFKDDLEFKKFPLHCISGTPGQQVIPELDIEDTLYIPHKVGVMGKYQLMQYPELIDLIKNEPKKILFEKQSIDVFTNPHVEYVLEKLDVTEVVVYGVATDYCVKEAVMGLLKRGFDTTLVLKTIMGVDTETSEKAIIDMKDEGAKFLPMNEVMQDDGF